MSPTSDRLYQSPAEGGPNDDNPQSSTLQRRAPSLHGLAHPVPAGDGAVMKWHSVSDGLPSDGEWVLVWNPALGLATEACFMRYRFSDNGDDPGYRWAMDRDEWSEDEVSHWMPMPAGPDLPPQPR